MKFEFCTINVMNPTKMEKKVIFNSYVNVTLFFILYKKFRGVLPEQRL